jgi:hypothetical protein
LKHDLLGHCSDPVRPQHKLWLLIWPIELRIKEQKIKLLQQYLAIDFFDIQNMNQAITLQLPDHEKGQTQLT